MVIESSHKVEVEIHRHDERTMILRQGLGEGTTDEGKSFDISTNVGNGDPTWLFHNGGRYYTVSLRNLTALVVDIDSKIK